jgi:hypothetical protein
MREETTCQTISFATGRCQCDAVSFTLATLPVDDNSWFDPQWVFYKKAQPARDITTEDVPYYEGMPPPT